MSLTINPNFNAYIERIESILNASELLWPHTIGEQEADDLIKQVIPYKIPDLLNPSGPQFPHIVITTSNNPIIFRQQTGRNSRDEQGPELLEMEFYIIVIAKSTTLVDTEAQMYSIISALTTTLDKNKRLVKPEDSTDPMSATSTWINVPYLIETDQKELIARNIIFRPKVYVNLRTP